MSIISPTTMPLYAGWELISTEAGAFAQPAALPKQDGWISAVVPGTVALSRQQAGLWNVANPQPLDHLDHWYRICIDATEPSTLVFDGLATDAEVWLDDERVLVSNNMYHQHSIEAEFKQRRILFICFRAIKALLAKPLKRARWRPAMISPATLRGARTTLLGHMSGWCPDVHAVGPWRPIVLIPHSAVQIKQLRMHAQLNADQSAVLEVSFSLNGKGPSDDVIIECGGVCANMESQPDGTFKSNIHLRHVEPWWPHTHGKPSLYQVGLTIGTAKITLGKVGFRRVEVDRGPDGTGFALSVNGVKVFCRGACWTSADVVGLSGSRAAYEPWLELMRDANMNMVRIGGTMLYESNDFYNLCDELGIMVWQDFMFANFDYPDSDEFLESVRLEASQFLTRTQCSPCIAVLCGGSEVAQQAAMLGLPKELWSSKLFAELLPEICRNLRTDVPYVANSPSGGDLPFVANAGVTHYYGVGAYQRPLNDARRASVRFASECLAFSNVPELTTLSHELSVPAVHHPLWKQRVPRDQGASWDFEDVRDFYLNLIFKVDPALLRRTDPKRYVLLSQAVTGEVMQAVFSEWRRNKSTCWGGLVWTFQDLLPGAGWGVVDAMRQPKPAWYALRRAFRSLQVVITDEGVNGLAVHAINESADHFELRLTIKLFNADKLIRSGSHDLKLQPRSNVEISATTILNGFVDINYAYRFGPLGHDVVVAELRGSQNDDVIAEAFYFPVSMDTQPETLEWQADVKKIADSWYLELNSNHFATGVHVEDDYFRPEDDWFHLVPGQKKIVRLIPRSAHTAKPDGEVWALNSNAPIRYRGAD